MARRSSTDSGNYETLSGKAPVRRLHTLPIKQKLTAGSTSELGHQLTKTELKRRDRRTVRLMHLPWKRSHTGKMHGKGKEV